MCGGYCLTFCPGAVLLHQSNIKLPHAIETEAPALWLVLVWTRITGCFLHSTRLSATLSARPPAGSPALYNISLSVFCLRLSIYQDVAEAVQLQSRAMRSPRRCIPHQQSCLGNTLPCCDRCDTRYPRMFGSICYCRRTACAGAHRRP
uniref:Agouti domain-containing protein n=1 Tax=Hucho hucho TaxID=62062 RepID=A0A4W5LHQ6_9TELE